MVLWGHILQATALSALLYESYLLSHDEMLDLGIGTLLHDFGKVRSARHPLLAVDNETITGAGSPL